MGNQLFIAELTSMATFYTTRELANELAKDKSRSNEQVRQDFEANYLILNEDMADKTITGKQINVTLQKIQLKNSIAEIQEQLTIFPNPSNGKANIKLTCFDYLSDIEITIYNIFGNEVFKHTTNCATSIPINSDTFSKGTYLIKMSAAGEIKHGKLIIN